MSFVSYLYKRGLSWSTVNNYLSALSFHNKINKYVDNIQSFVIRKMVDGLKRINAKKKDCRLPISRKMLEQIIKTLSKIFNSLYESTLFSAAFSLAFHGMLRVGELAQTGNKQSVHSLNIEDINIQQNCLPLLLKTSKTGRFGLG